MCMLPACLAVQSQQLYWCTPLGLKDPPNYKFCFSLLMLVYSLVESEVMSGFQTLGFFLGYFMSRVTGGFLLGFIYMQGTCLCGSGYVPPFGF